VYFPFPPPTINHPLSPRSRSMSSSGPPFDFSLVHYPPSTILILHRVRKEAFFRSLMYSSLFLCQTLSHRLLLDVVLPVFSQEPLRLRQFCRIYSLLCLPFSCRRRRFLVSRTNPPQNVASLFLPSFLCKFTSGIFLLSSISRFKDQPVRRFFHALLSFFLFFFSLFCTRISFFSGPQMAFRRSPEHKSYRAFFF